MPGPAIRLFYARNVGSHDILRGVQGQALVHQGYPGVAVLGDSGHLEDVSRTMNGFMVAASPRLSPSLNPPYLSRCLPPLRHLRPQPGEDPGKYGSQGLLVPGEKPARPPTESPLPRRWRPTLCSAAQLGCRGTKDWAGLRGWRWETFLGSLLPPLYPPHLQAGAQVGLQHLSCL